MKLYSPAKINLFLRILGKRDDGYHEIATLIQAIDLFDTLFFTPAENDCFTCTDPTLPSDDRNLVCKARALFQKKTGRAFPLHIHLEKKIPQEAGLGGGSSNAATTLWALNQLAGQPLSTDQLTQLSSEIGSDIPFFFSQGTALCTGRGEKIKNLAPLPQPYALYLQKPKEGLSSRDVYQKLDLNSCSREEPKDILARLQKGEPYFVNDLQKPAAELLPRLNNNRHTLTGSGSAYFSHEPIGIEIQFVQRSENKWFAPQIESCAALMPAQKAESDPAPARN